MQRGFSAIVILLVIVLISILGASLFFVGRQTAPKNFSRNSSQVVSSSPIASTKPTNTADNSTNSGWKTYTSSEGNYSLQYPSDWILEVFKDKFPGKAFYNKGYILFQNRPRTAQEISKDSPIMPVDIATGSVQIISTESMRGLEYSKISETEFFNPNSNFWPKGDAGGGGPGTTYSIPEEVQIAGKRAMKQETHPTTVYEWSSPNEITVDNYIWLGNAANEVVKIDITYDARNPNKDLLLNDFSQMLSTFKLNQ